jgi:hypothetical protein
MQDASSHSLSLACYRQTMTELCTCCQSQRWSISACDQGAVYRFVHVANVKGEGIGVGEGRDQLPMYCRYVLLSFLGE